MTDETAGAAGNTALNSPFTPAYCDQCGQDAGSGDHSRCAARRELEPPRYCPGCRRRMVVQVVPRGWTAQCSEHGTVASAAVS